jgi:hypothetical protein
MPGSLGLRRSDSLGLGRWYNASLEALEILDSPFVRIGIGLGLGESNLLHRRQLGLVLSLDILLLRNEVGKGAFAAEYVAELAGDRIFGNLEAQAA